MNWCLRVSEVEKSVSRLFINVIESVLVFLWLYLIPLFILQLCLVKASHLRLVSVLFRLLPRINVDFSDWSRSNARRTSSSSRWTRVGGYGAKWAPFVTAPWLRNPPKRRCCSARGSRPTTKRRTIPRSERDSCRTSSTRLTKVETQPSRAEHLRFCFLMLARKISLRKEPRKNRVPTQYEYTFCLISNWVFY